MDVLMNNSAVKPERETVLFSELEVGSKFFHIGVVCVKIPSVWIGGRTSYHKNVVRLQDGYLFEIMHPRSEVEVEKKDN